MKKKISFKVFGSVCLVILLWVSVYLISCKKDKDRLASSRSSLINSNKLSGVRLNKQTGQARSFSVSTTLTWKPTSWMKNLSSERSLAQISIPGTHESAALYGLSDKYRLAEKIPVINAMGICQDIPISEQLKIGVRYLDIRCHLKDGNFVIHHGPIYQKMNFDDVLVTCNTFLSEYPSETIIMKVQEENGPAGGSEDFTVIFNRYVNQYPNLFYRGSGDPNRILPKLGEARGKIVLMKKFKKANNVSVGIDVSARSAGGGVSTIQLSATELMKVQSVYRIGHKDEKAKYFLSLFNESFHKYNETLYKGLSMPSRVILFVNNTNAYKLGNRQIKEIAHYMGNVLLMALKDKGKGNTGIIPMDFVRAEYCKAIIDSNHFE